MIHKHLIDADAILRQAIARLNALPGGAMTLFVTDSAGRLQGTLTDGDLRRALAAGASLEQPASEAMCRNPRAVSRGKIPVEQFGHWRSAGIGLVPVLDNDGAVVGSIDIGHGHSCLPLRALLMAGGKGERLRPATLTTPKPLLHIGGKPIIDYNIEALRRAGITDINISTAYLAHQIEAHFEGAPDITCRRETQPLGTIGAAADLPPAEVHTLVMNSDLFTDIDLEQMYLNHRAAGADISVATIPYKVKVPYAVLGFEAGGAVRTIDEKPTLAFDANAGIYIFSPRALALLTPGRRTDATDLIATAIAGGLRAVHFPITGIWIDVGTPDDFRQASELAVHLRKAAPQL